MKRILTALLVDDEAPARSELRYLLGEAGGVEVIGEATSAGEALRLIAGIDYDVVFLDIEMPGMSGVHLAEILAAATRRPAIVFVTAHSQHAVKAFEVAAVDYLVKPVDLARLRTAIDRVAQFWALAEQAPAGPGPAGPPSLPERLPVERAGRKLLLNAADVLHVEASDGYTYVHVAGERYLSNLTMSELETRLASLGFVRVHRRHLVNMAMVGEVVPMYGGTLVLTLGERGEIQIPVSRRRVPALKQALGI